MSILSRVPASGVYVYLCVLSQVRFFATPWTVAHQDPLPKGILQARILVWVAISLSRGIFLTQGSNPHLLHLLHWQVDSLPLAPPGKPHKICIMYMYFPIENCLDYVQHIPSSFQCLWNYGLREVTTSNESEYIVDLTEAQLMSPHFDSHTNYYYFC